MDVTNEEIQYVQNKIDSLQGTKITRTYSNLLIQHTMLFTMIDAKVCNAATQTTSTMRCYICGATSKEFNNLSICRKKIVRSDTLKFGLSILHARIRFFESLLHISYKLPLKNGKLDYRKKKI